MAHHVVEHLTVRGFVERRPDGKWYAHCIDLTVDGLGETREQAVQKMEQEMLAYLNWATEKKVSLLRPSPLRFRLRYFVYVLRDKLRTLDKRRRPPRTFQMHPA